MPGKFPPEIEIPARTKCSPPHGPWKTVKHGFFGRVSKKVSCQDSLVLWSQFFFSYFKKSKLTRFSGLLGKPCLNLHPSYLPLTMGSFKMSLIRGNI